MSKIKLTGNASGTGVLTVTAPNTSTDRTITLPDSTGTLLTADGDGSSLTGVGVAGISSSADATAITINSSENVGIGVVPKVTNSTHAALELGTQGNWSSYSAASAGGEMDFQHNAYYAANGNDKYISTDEATKYRQGGGFHRFYTAPSGSADAAITFTQKVRIDSDGLKFNNDSAAANALDDYEEGLHTTSAGVGSGSITLNSTNNKFYYTKIGRQVTITGRIDVDSVSSPTGDLYFTLPFASATAGGSQNSSSAGGLFVWNPTSGDAGLWVTWLDSGGSNVYCRYASGNQASPAANLVQTATEFRIGLSYMTD